MRLRHPSIHRIEATLAGSQQNDHNSGGQVLLQFSHLQLLQFSATLKASNLNETYKNHSYEDLDSGILTKFRLLSNI